MERQIRHTAFTAEEFRVYYQLQLLLVFVLTYHVR